MDALPDTSNFHYSLNTKLSKCQIADLFRPLATKIRKCAWDEFEICFPWAELIIESESPILLHGAVADVLFHVEQLLALLREAVVESVAECYNGMGELLRELRWSNGWRHCNVKTTS
jgi:hypothetical protein